MVVLPSALLRTGPPLPLGVGTLYQDDLVMQSMSLSLFRRCNWQMQRAEPLWLCPHCTVTDAALGLLSSRTLSSASARAILPRLRNRDQSGLRCGSCSIDQILDPLRSFVIQHAAHLRHQVQAYIEAQVWFGQPVDQFQQ